MILQRLQVNNLRVLGEVSLSPGPGVNWLVGPNGAGKSSVLEAVSLLATGRSFRGGAVEGCIRRGERFLSVFGELVSSGGESGSARLRRVGLRRESRSFVARVDGEPVATLGALFAVCPAVCWQPDAGELVVGPGEPRRRFLDWGLFHVEPAFIDAWRRYSRVLRQRNAGLKANTPNDLDHAWREELAAAGQVLHAMRGGYVSRLAKEMVSVASWLLPEAGHPSLRFRPGWPEGQGALDAVLDAGYTVDRRQGFTAFGPHRAGWSLTFAGIPGREQYSRGQAKLAALCMALAQISDFSKQRQEAPIVALDDVVSELDPQNQSRLLSFLSQQQAQVLVTTADVHLLTRLRQPSEPLFHVEQGTINQGV